MGWTIKRTDTFLTHLKKHKHHRDLLTELEAEIGRLKQDPEKIGGQLSGVLHGNYSTRLTRNFRLIFSIDHKSMTVYLVAPDHRGKVYG